MSYDANIVKDLSTTTPTEGSSYIPELNDAVREIKRVIAYNEGVTAVSAYPATVAVTDTTLYCTGAGGTLNIPQLSTVSTTAYQKRIVVINDSSAALTFDPYSTETVGGSSTYSIPAGTIAEFLGHGGTDWEIVRTPASATPAVNTIPVRDSNKDIAVSDGTNLIHTKIIEIGDWNMDATASISVVHGLDYTKIRALNAIIRSDDNGYYIPVTQQGIAASAAVPLVLTYASVNYVTFDRAAGSTFDSVSYDSTGFNRGWITITYVE